MTQIYKPSIFFVLVTFSIHLQGQAILPPTMEWHGKSESLIAKSTDPWITPCEISGFELTPRYDETVNWFRDLAKSSTLFSMIDIGKSPEGRSIYMIIASTDTDKSAQALRSSDKPLMLAQAGIHAGEIDGKDAGMMLLRDIAFGKKKKLLNNVNFLFIPILNVDGHENASHFNRPNQRGPKNMGWRTNAQNLNLNRDYAKLDTREIQAVISVINQYKPLLYMDLHVTDGADYQYDITYTGEGLANNSPEISKWIGSTFKPYADTQLTSFGHIPGPLLFALNGKDFSNGILSFGWGARFSDGYGLSRHICTILVENHSLKPYKQRVLGTYVLLESTLKLLAKEGEKLKAATNADKARRASNIATAYKVPQLSNGISFESLNNVKIPEKMTPPDSITFLGIESEIRKSSLTNMEYVEWLGKPFTRKTAHFIYSESTNLVSRPKGYWVPPSCELVIERVKIHGIQMEKIEESKEVEVEMYRIENAQFDPRPYEGHLRVKGTTINAEIRSETYPPGSVYITTDQPLGDLAIILLEPISTDSYFRWGFFSTIFQRTEYIEAYVMEPLAQKMLAESPELKLEYQKKLEDEAFANDPAAIMSWFYSKSNYYDKRYLLYPVGRAK